MNNSLFGKTKENVRNHRDIKIVTSEKKRKRLVSEPNYHSCKIFFWSFNGNRSEKTRIKLNKPLYSGHINIRY